MTFVTRDVAMKKMVHHAYRHGEGFFDYGMPPELPPDANGAKNCLPPPGTPDGGTLTMITPHGQKLPMVWVAAESAWAPTTFGRGNRLAWTAEHLSKAGWEIAQPEKKAKRSPLVRGGDSR